MASERFPLQSNSIIDELLKRRQELLEAIATIDRALRANNVEIPLAAVTQESQFAPFAAHEALKILLRENGRGMQRRKLIEETLRRGVKPNSPHRYRLVSQSIGTCIRVGTLMERGEFIGLVEWADDPLRWPES